MALVLTVEDGTGLATANSYATVAEADVYHEGHLRPATWLAQDASGKAAALVHATRVLDGSTNWQGTRCSATQALAWPRDDVVLDGFTLDSTSVPQAVKNAVSELARLLIDNDLTEDAAQDNLASIGLGQGALDIQFNDRTKKRIPTIVDELLLGLGQVASGRGIVIRSVRR